jgi:hypothetical protein
LIPNFKLNCPGFFRFFAAMLFALSAQFLAKIAISWVYVNLSAAKIGKKNRKKTFQTVGFIKCFVLLCPTKCFTFV